MAAEFPLREIHRAWPFPDGGDLPEVVHPAVLLPHNPPDPPLSFVDFDDVRDPGTGEVSDEVATLVDVFNGYTDVSQSGTGLHMYVRGRLPEGIGAFGTSLSQRGALEIYDHSRFTGGTWRHVAGTHSIEFLRRRISSRQSSPSTSPGLALPIHESSFVSS